MNRRRFLSLLSGILFLAGCSEPPPQLPRLPSEGLILAFGDSITHGTGAAGEAAYPAVLAGLTGREVVNAGLPGETSDRGAERLPELLDQHRPALLLLCHGGNDLLRKWDPQITRSNLLRMIDAARARGVPVVLIGVPQPALFGLKSAAIYREVAAERGVPYEGETLPAVLGKNDLKSDAIHPNAAGYRQLAEALAALLRKSGAI